MKKPLAYYRSASEKNKKIMIWILIIVSALLVYTIYSVTVNFIRKSSPAVIQLSAADVKSVQIGCYPELFDGDVTVIQEDVVQELVSTVNTKTFSYWGTTNKRNFKSGGFLGLFRVKGGYFSHFNFYDAQGNELASFGFDSFVGGYVVQKNGLVYKLPGDDTELDSLCSELIDRAKNKEFPPVKS